MFYLGVCEVPGPQECGEYQPFVGFGLLFYVRLRVWLLWVFYG